MSQKRPIGTVGDAALTMPVKRSKTMKLPAKPTTDTLQRQLTSLKRKVRTLESERELKAYDATDSGDIAYDVDNTFTLCDPAQGDTDLTRDGSKIFPKRIEVRLKLLASASATAPVTIRASIIRSKERFIPDTAVNTSPQGCWEYGGLSTSVLSPWKFENARHFTVLHDEIFQLGPYSATDFGGGNNSGYMYFTKKLGGRIEFEDTGTTGEHGQLYLLLTCDVANAGANPTHVTSVRTWYTDS